MIITSIALFSQSRSCTDAVLRALEAALPLELADRVALWKPASPDLVVPAVRVVSSVTELKDTDMPYVFSETFDDPGAVAYHWVKNNFPYALIWSPPESTRDEITERAAHESEALNDPLCDRYDAEGWSVEDSDAPEGIERWRETATEGRVRVCAFCGPEWFGLTPASVEPGPLDNAGACKARHEVPAGGYGRRLVDGKLVDQPPGMKLPPHKRGPHARSTKRERRLAAARHDAMPDTLRDTLQSGAPASKAGS